MEYKCNDCGKIVYRSPSSVKDPSKYVCGDCHLKRCKTGGKREKHDWSVYNNLKNMYERKHLR